MLDFFAGSGSTGDAVMKLNAEDGGNRRFLLVQLPEQTGADDYRTISEITKARLRAAAAAVKDAGASILPGASGDSSQVDFGFRVYKLDSSNIKPWDASFDGLDAQLFDAVDNVKPDRSEADVLYELLLKMGLDLAVPIEEREIDGRTVYVVGAGALIVCLARPIALDLVEGVAALKKELQPEVMRVVFRDSGFEDDVAKTNAVQILRQAGIEDIKSL